MNKHPSFLPVFTPDLDEFIDKPATLLSIFCYLLKLLIKKLIAQLPVNFRMDFPEKEFEKFWKELFHNFFPGAVIIILFHVACTCYLLPVNSDTMALLYASAIVLSTL